MAKVKSIIQLKGTIGGLNFYERLGVPVVRQSGGGFNGKAIKTKESMVRVRENGSEFGLCSRLKSQYQRSLSYFYTGFKDGTLHGRLMRLFLDIKDLDPVSARGERRVFKGLETAAGKELLRRFVYTPHCRIVEKLGGQFVMDWDALQLKIETADPEQVYFPDGASHLELKFAVVVFDFEHLSYTVTHSEPLRIARGAFPGEVSMGVPELPEGGGVKLAFLGLRYYEDVAGVRYYFKQVNGFGVEVCSSEFVNL